MLPLSNLSGGGVSGDRGAGKNRRDYSLWKSGSKLFTGPESILASCCYGKREFALAKCNQGSTGALNLVGDTSRRDRAFETMCLVHFFHRRLARLLLVYSAE